MGLIELQTIKKAAYIMRGLPQVAKPKAPIKKVSKKMVGLKDQLKRLYPKFLKKKPFCEIKSPVCTKVATVIHHAAGRIGEKLLDQKDWMASCPACNGYVEDNDAWAREHGFKKSKFKKETK